MNAFILYICCDIFMLNLNNIFMKKTIAFVAISLATLSLTAATHIRGMHVDCGNGKVWEISFSQDVALETCDEIALTILDYFCD